jgi:hypothetical protein
VDYLILAYNINPSAVNALVSQIVPKTLWETPINDISDPTWTTASISWSSNPDVWEAARAQLATIIGSASMQTVTVQATGGAGAATTTVVAPLPVTNRVQ